MENVVQLRIFIFMKTRQLKKNRRMAWARKVANNNDKVA